ncbi:hypothetical protein HDU81_009467 [Chytriomyces hyalinus]|nr:hypothetical protein HDU81_009467 [Chytriomyces hyalinus]
MQATVSNNNTRHRRRPRRNTRVRARPKPCSQKGDAEIPSDIELLLLEAEARRKVHTDRERHQPLHALYVAEMRVQLEKEQLMLGSITSSDGEEDDDDAVDTSPSPEQVAQGLSELADVALKGAVVDDMGPAWLPPVWCWPMDPFTCVAAATDVVVDTHPLLQAPSQQVLEYTSRAVNSFNHSDGVISFTNFEELFNAYPLPPLAWHSS